MENTTIAVWYRPKADYLMTKETWTYSPLRVLVYIVTLFPLLFVLLCVTLVRRSPALNLIPLLRLPRAGPAPRFVPPVVPVTAPVSYR